MYECPVYAITFHLQLQLCVKLDYIDELLAPNILLFPNIHMDTSLKQIVFTSSKKSECISLLMPLKFEKTKNAFKITAMNIAFQINMLGALKNIKC